MLADPKLIYLFVYVSDLAKSRTFYEEKLGFRVIEEDSGAVKYDAGGIILALNRAKDFGIDLAQSNDDTSMIVFHVDDIDAMRAAMEKRGVEFSGPTDRYEIGATAIFYDPDGHCYSLYEPSTEAMTWPSADKIRAVLDAGSAAPASDDLLLGSRRLLYLFLFVKDVNESLEFYKQKLGMRLLEESPEAGVAKYDAGGFLLATHLVESEEKARAGIEDLDRAKGIAPVFYVSDIKSAHKKLSGENVRFATNLVKSQIGITARFEDPSGHVFYLYQPSAEALNWPSGSKVKELSYSEIGHHG